MRQWVPPLLRFYRSPIGKKLITGITGLALATFALVHMLGNLTLFLGQNAYNSYGDHLADLGVLLYAIEGILLGGGFTPCCRGHRNFCPSPQGQAPGLSAVSVCGKGQLPKPLALAP